MREHLTEAHARESRRRFVVGQSFLTRGLPPFQFRNESLQPCLECLG